MLPYDPPDPGEPVDMLALVHENKRLRDALEEIVKQSSRGSSDLGRRARVLVIARLALGETLAEQGERP